MTKQRLWICIPSEVKELAEFMAIGAVVIASAVRGKEWEAEIEVDESVMDKLDPYFGRWVWGPMDEI